MISGRIILTGKGSRFVTQCALELIAEGLDAIVISNDGEELLDCCKRLEPSAIFTDVHLLGLDPFEVVQSLADNSRPMLFIWSAEEDPIQEARMLKAGATYCFIKHSEPRFIVERIRQFLGIGSIGPTDFHCFGRSSELMLTEILKEIGIPAHLKGFHYLRFAILQSINEGVEMHSITKGIYPAIARSYNSTIQSVERSIRHAIDIVWKKGNMKALGAYFAFVDKNERSKPNNSEFIAVIADSLRLKLLANSDYMKYN